MRTTSQLSRQGPSVGHRPPRRRPRDGWPSGQRRHAPAPPGLPLQHGEELAQRPQRPGLPQGRLPPLLPAQPARRPAGATCPGATPRARISSTGTSSRWPSPSTRTRASSRAPSSSTTRTARASAPPRTRRMVAIYTSAYTAASGRDGIQAQSLAYSTDDGQTWTKYAGNPVIDIGSREFRDPKVFWYEPAKEWRMVAVIATDHKVHDLAFGEPQGLDPSLRLRSAGTRPVDCGSAQISSRSPSTGTPPTSSGSCS